MAVLVLVAIFLCGATERRLNSLANLLACADGKQLEKLDGELRCGSGQSVGVCSRSFRGNHHGHFALVVQFLDDEHRILDGQIIQTGQVDLGILLIIKLVRAGQLDQLRVLLNLSGLVLFCDGRNILFHGGFPFCSDIKIDRPGLSGRSLHSFGVRSAR